MRDLTRFDDNETRLVDPVTGTIIIFYHRTPETADRVSYMSQRFRREGKKLIIAQKQAAINAAAAVLTGVSDGSFACGRDAENNPVPMSSNPALPHYREDWKQQLVLMAGDLLYILGNQLFEGPPDADDLSGLTIVNGDAAQISPQPEETISPLAIGSGN